MYLDYIHDIAKTGARGIVFLQTAKHKDVMNRWACLKSSNLEDRLVVVEAYYGASQHEQVLDYAENLLGSTDMTVRITGGLI